MPDYECLWTRIPDKCRNKGKSIVVPYATHKGSLYMPSLGLHGLDCYRLSDSSIVLNSTDFNLYLTCRDEKELIRTLIKLFKDNE